MALEVTNKESKLDRLETLKKLQSIDNKTHELNKQKKALLSRVEEKNNQIEEAKARLASRHEKSVNSQKEIDMKNLDLKCIEEGIQKSRVKLLQIKNNKEYSAFLSEIGGKEADKSLLEDQILSMMSDLERLTAEEKDSAKEEEKQKKELAELKAAVDGELAVIDKNIEGTQTEWEGTARQVDKESLVQYKRLIEKDGQAVVEVSGHTCGGCYMQITPQTLNLLLRKQELILCKNCGKILYLQEG
ncbi:MAG: C4-type zinc ribbon domain-containing protein [Planctomycetota bacterium]|jgi:predicted  nucleic acid-binding Zn-ribbon protein